MWPILSCKYKLPARIQSRNLHAAVLTTTALLGCKPFQKPLKLLLHQCTIWLIELKFNIRTYHWLYKLHGSLQSETWLLHPRFFSLHSASPHNTLMSDVVSAFFFFLTGRINSATATAKLGDKLWATTEADRHTTVLTVYSRGDKAVTVWAEIGVWAQQW